MDGIASTVLTLLVVPIVMAWVGTRQEITLKKALAQIEQQGKDADAKRDAARVETQAKREAEAKWRDCVVSRLDDQDERIGTILQAQCSQIRSDIIHKCHRYLDDLGRASTEEKEALKAEHNEYSKVCEANGIVNNFVDIMVQRVMELPERDV